MMNAPASTSSSGGARPYASSYHVPVLCEEVVEHLVTNPSGVYVDATIGGGGHAAALLDALASAGRVVGIDQDAEALSATRTRLPDAITEERLQLVRGNFERLEHLILDTLGFDAVDGLLLDLGVSSHQLDEAQRGFSFQQEAPLDMRMDDRQGLTADAVVNDWSEEDLRDALYAYGEERASGRIARAIVEARPLRTTTALADAVRRVIPTREEVKTLARVFQGIRIAVNRELSVLEAALQQAATVLRIGGRVAIISYHSLEDRRVKRVFRHGNLKGEPRRDVYGNPVTPWEELTRKPVRASDDEVKANPRARSARLRVAERITEPDLPAVP